MKYKLPTVKIKENEYVLVKDRVAEFNRLYPNGCIQTELLTPPESNIVVIKAIITPDIERPTRFFTDYSQAKWGDGYINKTSALENASTSAVGRALAYMGIGIIDSIASADEMAKAGVLTPKTPQTGLKSPSVASQAASVEVIKSAIEKITTVDQAKQFKEKIKESSNLTEEDKNNLLGTLELKEEILKDEIPF